jgi:hypothetical protein
LRVLSVAETNINDSALSSLVSCNVDIHESLVKINLSHTKITNECLGDGALGAFVNLTLCVLDRTKVTRIAWEYLKGRCAGLEKPRFYGMIEEETE